MAVDYIAYETLIATRFSADWVKYGAIAAWVSAVAGILTLAVAATALNTWKNQEKTKIRSEFKRSLLALDYAVHMMPDEWNPTLANMLKIRADKRAIDHSIQVIEADSAYYDLKKAWHNAISAWVMCEGQLKETNLTKQWNELSDLYVNFLKGIIDKGAILKKLAEMHSVEFIF